MLILTNALKSAQSYLWPLIEIFFKLKTTISVAVLGVHFSRFCEKGFFCV